MRTLIDFSKTPCIFEVTDEEFAEYERRNAKEIELRELIRGHDEAQAIYNAEKRGEERAKAKWQGVIADKDTAFANKDAALADRDSLIADKDALIAELQAKLGIRT